MLFVMVWLVYLCLLGSDRSVSMVFGNNLHHGSYGTQQVWAWLRGAQDWRNAPGISTYTPRVIEPNTTPTPYALHPKANQG